MSATLPFVKIVVVGEIGYRHLSDLLRQDLPIDVRNAECECGRYGMSGFKDRFNF